MKKGALLLLLAAAGMAGGGFLFPARPRPPAVTLAWDAVTGFGPIGYRLYDGNGFQQFTQVVACGANLSGTVSNLDYGAMYFFAVTASDTNGQESAFSDTVSYHVPDAPVPVPAPHIKPPTPD